MVLGICRTCDTVLEVKTCSGCYKVTYCGKWCQMLDWANHKHMCNIPKSTKDSTEVLIKKFKQTKLEDKEIVLADVRNKLSKKRRNKNFDNCDAYDNWDVYGNWEV